MNMLAHINQDSGQNQPTMSSPELVDFINDFRKEACSKPTVLRHDSFMAKVPQVLGVESAPKFIGTENYTNGTGGRVQRTIYVFPKREACLMAMSYSYELQARVFDRMTAMENYIAEQFKPSYMIEDPIKRAEKWIEEQKQSIQLQQQVAILEPKAKGLDRIADCTNVTGIRESAKVLKIGQNQLTQYLIDHKVVYRDQFSKIQAYQKSINQNLVHVVTSAPRLTDSGEKVFTQVKLTQKLITRIAKWLEKGVMA